MAEAACICGEPKGLHYEDCPLYPQWMRDRTPARVEAEKPEVREQIARALTPGDVLAVLLRDRGMTQAALATALGRPPQMVSEIVTGRKRVTAATAVQFQRVFGLPALVWLGLQAHADVRRALGATGNNTQEEDQQ